MAARNIELGRGLYGCIEISMVVWREIDQRKFTLEKRHAIDVRARYYFRMVAPPQIPDSGFWWRRNDRAPRIIGLCLAAAIAESEGD